MAHDGPEPELTEEELARQRAEPLPDREAMSVLDPGSVVAAPLPPGSDIHEMPLLAPEQTTE